MPNQILKANNKGFSLFELLIAMVITMVIMGIASRLIATSFNMRARENSRTDSIADVQRALNIMSREIAIGGYGFEMSNNGLVSGDCDKKSVRVRSNLNRYTDNSTTIESSGEDLKYFIDSTGGQNFLVRYDRFGSGGVQKTVLANRIDDLDITYWGPTNVALDVATNPALVSTAIGMRITVSANLEEVGRPGTPGFQPRTVIQLSSDVTFRNHNLNLLTY